MSRSIRVTLLWLVSTLTILGMTHCAHAQTFSLFRPAAGILKGQTTTYVTTAAASSDVISLWTGSCSSTTFLRGDGSCQAPGGAGIGTVTSIDASWTSSGITVSGGPITTAGTLAFSGTLNVASGGTGATTLTGLLEGAGTGAINPAESADVITLWTGTCDTTTFLRGDGSCQTIAGNTDASTLTTGTLADARLSSNVPLKNAANVFTGITQMISAAAANLLINDTGGGTNTKAGRLIHTGNSLLLQACNDAFSTCSNAVSVAHSGAGATVDIVNITGTAVNVNGNAALTSASTLNGTNVGTGTVADARLSSNVPLKNVPGQTFTNVGNNTFKVTNSSTGTANIQIDTNGLSRGGLCSSTSAGACVTGDAANDFLLYSSQRMNISTNNGSSVNASISNAAIDLNATAVNANGSRINTVANSWKTAAARIAIDGTLTRNINFTSSVRNSTGNYTVNYTAAGFTSLPVCVVSSESTVQIAATTVGSTTSTTILNTSFVTGSPVGSDGSFSITCHGP